MGKSAKFFDEDTVSIYEKILNRQMKKKFDWFDKIEVYELSFDYLGFNPYLGIKAKIYVDEDWGGKQFREYYYTTSMTDELSFGDIIGGDLSRQVQRVFLDTFQLVTGEIAKTTSWSWVDVKFVESKENNLQEQIRRILKEETEIPLRLRRRLPIFIEKAFEKNLKRINRKKSTKKEDYFKKVIEYTLCDLHGDYFVYNKLSDEEWEEYKKYIISYIESNYKI